MSDESAEDAPRLDEGPAVADGCGLPTGHGLQSSRVPAPRRRFTLLDGMIAIAAMAVELGVSRSIHSDLTWIPTIDTPIPFGPVDRVLFRGVYEQEIFLTATTSAAIAALAALSFRLRRPRPRWSRLIRQPGAVASLATVLAWAIVLSCILVCYAARRFPDRMFLDRNWGVPAIFAGFGVASAWGLLVLTRSWKSERSWVDRFGRVVGFGTLALGLWGICFCAIA